MESVFGQFIVVQDGFEDVAFIGHKCIGFVVMRSSALSQKNEDCLVIKLLSDAPTLQSEYAQEYPLLGLLRILISCIFALLDRREVVGRDNEAEVEILPRLFI